MTLVTIWLFIVENVGNVYKEEGVSLIFRRVFRGFVASIVFPQRVFVFVGKVLKDVCLLNYYVV